MAIIGALDIIFGADTNPWTKGKNKVSKDLQSLKKEAQIGDLFSQMFASGGQAVAGFATKLAGPIAAFFTLKKVVSEVNGQIDKIAGMQKLGDRIGMTANQVQTLQMAFKKAGMEADAVPTALARLQKNISEATQGGEMGQTFTQLKLNAQQLAQLPLDKQFRTVIDTISKIPNETDRIRIAMEIFGREGGAAIARGFKEGSKTLDDMAKKLEGLGLAISPEVGAKFVQYKKSASEFDLALEGIWRSITAVIALPIVERLTDINVAFTKGIATNKTVIDDFSTLGTILTTIMESIVLLTSVFTGFCQAIGGMIGDVLGDVVNLANWFLKIGERTSIFGGYFKEWLAPAHEFMDIFGTEMKTKSNAMIDRGERNLGGGLLQDVFDASAERNKKKPEEKKEHKPLDMAALQPKEDPLKKLKEQVATFGQVGRATEIYELRQKKATEAIIQQAIALDKQLAVLEIQKEVFESNPVNKAEKENERYAIAVREGSISMAQYNRHLKEQVETITGITDPLDEGAKKLSYITQMQRDGFPVGDAYAKIQKQIADSILGFDSDPIKTLDDKWQLLTRGVKEHKWTQDQANEAYNKFRHSIMEFPASPAEQMQNFRSELAKLKKDLSPEEYNLALADKLTKFGVVKLPVDEMKTYKGELSNLNTLLRDGTINQRQYNASVEDLQKKHFGIDNSIGLQMDTFHQKLAQINAIPGLTPFEKTQATLKVLPDYLKSALDSTETPLGKLGDSLNQLKQWKDVMPKDLYDKARKNMLGAYADQNKVQFGGALQGQAARSAILNYKFGQQDKDAIAKDALQESKKHSELLKELVDNRVNPAPAF
jgi:hypothetical protein